MNTLKGWITTLVLAVTLMTSTAVASTGIIIGGRADNQPCMPPVKEDVDYSIIIGGFASDVLSSLTSIIIGGKSGIIIGGKEVPSENCGIIIGG
jgi:hypothetical protein